MISTNLGQWQNEKPAYHAVFNQVLDYIAKNDLNALDVGKYQIVHDKLYFFIQVYPTIALSSSKPETHIQFIDLQYLMEGEEKIGFSRIDKMSQITEDKSQTNDMIYYRQDTPQDVLTMKPGDICIFFPHDIHRTRGQVESPVTIKKAVFKIHLSLLG